MRLHHSQSGNSQPSASATITTNPITDLSAAFSEPAWSVRSLLPPASGEVDLQERISPQTLRHLLRLSSLPAPGTAKEQASMLSTLQSQLHFVRDIQSVDTAGIEPLQAICDETSQGQMEAAIGLDNLKHVLEQEVVVGHNKRPRRRKNLPVDTNGTEKWDSLGTASKTVGRYFVVDSDTLKGDE